MDEKPELLAEKAGKGVELSTSPLNESCSTSGRFIDSIVRP
jgi:hypothetical protein